VAEKYFDYQISNVHIDQNPVLISKKRSIHIQGATPRRYVIVRIIFLQIGDR